MNKNIKISFVLFLISAAIIVAWRTLQGFFHGAGINFAAMIVVLSILLALILSDKLIFKRIKDLFFTLCFLTLMEMIVYFATDFTISLTCIKGFIIFQNILSILGVLFLFYTMFRFVLELKEIKIGFVEFMLGNKNTSKHKPRKAKELENGTLEEKPNSAMEEFSYYESLMSEKAETENKDEE